MYLAELSINNLRNIISFNSTFEDGINILHGENGCGKSSIVEAISLLLTNRSFRTTNKKSLIPYTLLLDNKVSNQLIIGKIIQSDLVFDIGYQLDICYQKQLIHINKEKITRSSDLAFRFPLYTLTNQSSPFLSGSALQRRNILDWFLFHVEQHTYFNELKNFKRALQQRNTFLKRNRANWSELDTWDLELSQYSEKITRFRRDSLKKIETTFNILIDDYFSNKSFANNLCFKFKQGWSEQVSLKEKLMSQRDKDVSLGYTSSGSHRDDFSIIDTPSKQNIRDFFSNGELSLISLLFHISIIFFIKTNLKKSPILLMDDVMQYFDRINIGVILDIIYDLKIQTFITTPSLTESFTQHQNRYRLFHVEQLHTVG